jgi:hypothetical protein
LLAAGCQPATPSAEDSIEFTALLPSELQLGDEAMQEGAWRFAVVWVEDRGVRVSDGGRVRDGLVSGRAKWPRHMNTERLLPRERVLLATEDYDYTVGGTYIAPRAAYADAYRPRVVVYRDEDEDAELSLERTSPDRVIASDAITGIAALLDPEAAVRQMSFEQAREYYADGRGYSRFLFASGNGSELRRSPPSALSLVAGVHAERREEILCGRAMFERRLSIETRVFIDEALDPEATCPRGVADCRGVSLTTSEAPVLADTDAVERFAVCRQSADLEALLIYEATSACDDCVCETTPSANLYLAVRDDVPSWWPCGTSVDYCRDGYDLTTPAYCTVLTEPSEAVDAGVPDAGVPDAGIRTLE